MPIKDDRYGIEDSILKDFYELRTSFPLDQELRKDQEYQEADQQVKKALEKLEVLSLPKEEWKIIDRILSLSNVRAAEGQKVSYMLGFHDAIRMFRETFFGKG